MLITLRAGAWLALATIFALAEPAGAFEAVVYLPDGQPAVDARVLLLGQTGGARTGPDGRFSWVPEPRTPFQVLIVLPGDVHTAPLLVEELPTDGSPLVLTVLLAASDTVTVEAGASPHTEAPPANAATLLLREDVAQRRPPNLTDTISGVPGAGRVGEGRAAAPSLRGLARGRTLVLIDGARVTSERRAGPSATFLDPATLEAVEIARGPGSVAWGADAFGGVIHARTRKAPRGGGWAGRVDASLGAGAPQRAVLAEVARGLGDGGFLSSRGVTATGRTTAARSGPSRDRPFVTPASGCRPTRRWGRVASPLVGRATSAGTWASRRPSGPSPEPSTPPRTPIASRWATTVTRSARSTAGGSTGSSAPPAWSPTASPRPTPPRSAGRRTCGPGTMGSGPRARARRERPRFAAGSI